MLKWTAGLDGRLLFALMVGVFMGALDLTIVAPALADIAAGLNVTPAAVVLAFSIYGAFYAVSVPLMSKLADVWGHARIYRIALLLFAAGSLLAAVSPTLLVLIVARIVQGIGGGGLFPVAQAIIGAKLPEKRRGKALGLLLGVFAAGGVLGPNLGGFLTQVASWRWIFWINVPLGIAGVLLIRAITMPVPDRPKRIDWPGAALVALIIGSLVLGLESMRHVEGGGVLNMQGIVLFSATIVCTVFLVLSERHRRDPIVDVGFVASRKIGPLLIVSFLVGYSLLAGVIFVPLYAQIIFGATTLGSGAILNAAAAGLGIASYLAGHYTAAAGPKRLTVIGMALTALGLGAMILFRQDVPGLLAGLMILGAGLGLSQGPLSYLALSVAPEDKHGQISGLIAITRSMGGASGITLAGVLLGRAGQGIQGTDELAELEAGEVWEPGSSIGALQDIPESAREVVIDALGTGLVHGWYWAFGAAAIGLAVSLFLKEEPRDAQDDS